MKRELIKFLRKNCKKIKYEITTPFGLRNKGDIIEAYKICTDYDSGFSLIFHPPNIKHYEVASFEFCKINPKTERYISKDKDSYVNL